MKPSVKLLALLACSVLGASVALAQKPEDTGKPSDPPQLRGKGSVESETVRTLLQDFATKREQYIAERKALIEKLKTATDAEKKQILDQLKADQQARIDEQRELAKQIRDELKKLREARKSGNGG
jgi:hypothetical protein